MTRAQHLAQLIWAEMEDAIEDGISFRPTNFQRVADDELTTTTDDVLQGILERVMINLGCDGESGEFRLG